MGGVEFIIGLVAGTPIGYYLGRTFAPKFEEKLRRKRLYKEWCADLYCELWEFNETYLESKPSSKISSVKVLIDYRALHKALTDTPKYLIRMQKGGEAVKELKRLHSCVDNHWHNLQDVYSVNFQLPEYIQEIIDIGKEKRDKIRKDIEKNIEKIKSIEVGEIMEYLKSESG